MLKHGGDAGPEGRVRLPDGAGYRLPDTANWAPGRYSRDDSVPSLTVEVRSPEQPLGELRRKCRTFRANDVDVCWLIDPAARSVEVFDSTGETSRVLTSDALEPEVMPGFSLSLTDLFAVLSS